MNPGLRLLYLAAFLLCLVITIAAQTPPEVAREYTAAHRAELVQQFSELLSIPNVAADPANLKRNADLLLGPIDQSGQQTVVFGARGDAHLAITVYGPHHGLRSGHYGNWAPNPAMMLAQLLAGMKDEDGRVLVPHFYDGIEPLSAAEKEALARAPVNDCMLMNAFGWGTSTAQARICLS